MSLNKLSESVEELSNSTQTYLDKNYQYYKLSAFKKLTKGTTSLITFMILGAILFAAALLLTFALALFIGSWLDNTALGFLLLGLLYIVLALIVFYGFRKTIERKVLIRASKDFFDND